MRINKLITALSFFSAVSLYSADTLNFNQVAVNAASQLSYRFNAGKPITIEKIRATRLVEANVSMTASELENAQITIYPKQNVKFNGAAFAFVQDDKGNRYSIPAHIVAEAHYSEAYDSVSYNKYGEELIVGLRAYLSNIHKVYSYNESRDIMYGYVDNYDGIVECPYTGNTIETAKRPDGNAKFDTEHTWPQMFGAGQAPEQTDMHHMRPSWKSANNKRGNSSFGNVTTSVSSSQGGYAEGGSELGKNEDGTWVFEVRDEYKGDIARGIFYFALRYGNKANNNNPNDRYLDAAQYGILNEWHNFDQISVRESERNSRIKERQFSHNPFIEHPAIIERMNLIGEFTPVQYSFAADSLIVFTNATELPIYFFNDNSTKLEYAHVVGNSQFSLSIPDSNAAALSIYSININHQVSEIAHNAELKVKFIDSPEYTVLLISEPSSAVKCLKDCASELVVYPNPTNDFVQIRVESTIGFTDNIEFYDASGKLLYPEFSISENNGYSEISVDCRGIQTGQVFFNVISSDKSILSGLINIAK